MQANKIDFASQYSTIHRDDVCELVSYDEILDSSGLLLIIPIQQTPGHRVIAVGRFFISVVAFMGPFSALWTL
jgi:hypothetical protein